LLAERIGFLGVLVEQIDAQLIRPPILVGSPASGMMERAFTLIRHCSSPLWSVPAIAADGGRRLDPLRLADQFMKDNKSIDFIS
jgi:hypothetical protein